MQTVKILSFLRSKYICLRFGFVNIADEKNRRLMITEVSEHGLLADWNASRTYRSVSMIFKMFYVFIIQTFRRLDEVSF